MAKPPGKPPQKRDPAKHSKKDPARPTRAKAARPDVSPIEPALAQLLNPGIAQGTAGPGSQTGLKPPPDNSFDRRRDFSEAHRARKSTQGFGEAPQSGYVAKTPVSPGELDPDLARALGIEDEQAQNESSVSDTAAGSPLPSPLWGGGGGGVIQNDGFASRGNNRLAHVARCL